MCSVSCTRLQLADRLFVNERFQIPDREPFAVWGEFFRRKLRKQRFLLFCWEQLARQPRPSRRQTSRRALATNVGSQAVQLGKGPAQCALAGVAGLPEVCFDQCSCSAGDRVPMHDYHESIHFGLATGSVHVSRSSRTFGRQIFAEHVADT